MRTLLEGEVAPVEVSRLTGVPYSTVLRWSRPLAVRPPRPFRPARPAAYTYLLGVYLGDGCVNAVGTSHQLVISLDGAHPGIVGEVVAAVEAVRLPYRPARVRAVPSSRCVTVTSGWKRWPEAFPQHGPGRKHERPIVLAPWQQALVDTHPEPFLRGLIHSDGCRTVNRFTSTLPSGRVREYAYARYFFSNLSPGIRGLFCTTCDRLGIRWTRSSARNVSVSHRDSVAALDRFVGPKA